MHLLSTEMIFIHSKLFFCMHIVSLQNIILCLQDVISCASPVARSGKRHARSGKKHKYDAVGNIVRHIAKCSADLTKMKIWIRFKPFYRANASKFSLGRELGASDRKPREITEAFVQGTEIAGQRCSQKSYTVGFECSLLWRSNHFAFSISVNEIYIMWKLYKKGPMSKWVSV